MKLLIKEKDKYKNDKEAIKQVVEHFETDGLSQVYRKAKTIKKLNNLANGVLNQEDYIDYEEETGLLGQDGAVLEDAGLMFYPIIPNIIQGILGDFDKRYSEYFVEAINPEHTNDILEKLNQDLRTNLIEAAEARFITPETTEEEYNEFINSDKIQKYYLSEHRSTIEQWANHKIKVDDERLGMKHIEREILNELIVTERPAVHVNYLDGEYNVHTIPSKDLFYIKSPNNRDLSESQMVGWFEHETIDTILNKYANLLTDRQVEKLSGWTGDLYKNEFVVNNLRQTGNVTAELESKQNYLAFNRLYNNPNERRYDDYQSDLIRITHMYFLLPRKIGRLYYKGEGTVFSQLVTDDFKVTIKPIYSGKEKTKETLLEGEHVEWFYHNELWRAIKMDVKHSGYHYKEENEDEKTIWAFLDKNPIQYSDPNYRFGIRIPIHGGPTTNRYSDPISGVEKAAPLQIMYNWLWNRMQQLLSTEVGKFIIINQNMIPQESFDGSWGKNNLLKWFMVAKDTSIAPADPSITNMGQSSSQIAGGFGQVVDLTKTNELLEKANLAAMIKAECFQQFGFTPETIYGDRSPQQSGVSQAQQLQRSLTQIQHYYTRLDEIMRKTWDTILETAQFKATDSESELLSYMGDDKARVIFQSDTSSFLLYKLATFTKSSAADSQTLETIKQIALSNNTMGADTLETAAMISSKSTPELMEKLRELKAEKEKLAKEQVAQEEARQQQLVDQQHKNSLEIIAEQDRQSEIEFERDVVLKQIGAVGFGNSSADEIRQQVEALAKQDLEERKYQSTLDYREKVDKFKEKTLETKSGESQKQRDLQEKIKLKELELREKDIEARNTRSKAID